MGKKRARSKKTSKGIHTAVKTKVSLPFIDRELNRIAAWKAGKNPWVTVDVDGSTIRVRANNQYGDPRKKYNIFGKPKEGQ